MQPNQFPKTHLLLTGVLTLGLFSIVIAKFFNDDAGDRFTTESVLLDLPALPLSNVSEGATLTAPDPETETQTPHAQVLERVKPGDNLANIFKRHGIPAKDLQSLNASKPFGPRLKRIFPGHEFVFSLAEDGTLIKLAYSPGPLELLEFKRVGDTFVGYEVTKTPERTTAYKHATIDHSLFVASQRAGLDDAFTMRLAEIFQWDIDFVLEIRSGDEFYILFEELYLDDEFIRYGKILAAEFVNQGDSYRAVRYTDTRGKPDYYDQNGDSMRKAFLRAPLKFSRISSNFNLRRLHPLWKRTMPHRGIDYAAPDGTPILASGDGKVIQASRSQ
ncbi:MAG: LysM peptidoglycan-binding domain-containing protein, partial [Gammaproteobacteria bacterium]|nr:LysM peptidoglycan-binding domain-containing protein [Gammaproteobacteria bacterium]